jgi:hypothetical protein
MMTVLEFETGLTKHMNESRKKLGVLTMSAAIAEKYSSTIKERVWKLLSLTEHV